MSNPKVFVGALALSLVGACSGQTLDTAPPEPDPRVGQVAQAIYTQSQSGAPLTTSGLFRPNKWGKSVLTCPGSSWCGATGLVPDTTFFASNGTLATMGQHGYTLVDVDIDTSTGTRLYAGVFEAGVPSTQYWDLVPSDFANKVSSLDASGWRLIALRPYFSPANGSLFYFGVFQTGGDPQLYPGALTQSAFNSTMASNKSNGYFLTNLSIYYSSGQEQYLGVWRYHPESTSKSDFLEGEWNALVKQDELERAQGMRMVTMAHAVINGDRKYAGIWLEGNDAFNIVAATDLSVYQRKVSELATAGLVPTRINIELGYQPPAGLGAAFNDEFDPEVVGYSYGVSEKGARTAAGAFGYARGTWETISSPMSQTTRMDIASATKAVAATALYKLLEGSSQSCTGSPCTAANFKITTPIVNILQPTVTVGAGVSQVTVGNLINMTSGLCTANAFDPYPGTCPVSAGTYVGSPANTTDCDDTYHTDHAGWLACALQNCTVNKNSGNNGLFTCASPPAYNDTSTNNNYSSTDYGVLRSVVEKLSGKSFEQYINDALFVPAGINNGNLSATDLSNANCNPDLSTNSWVPLYYRGGDSQSSSPGIIEANSAARGEAVCGAGGLQMNAVQLDLFTRGLMTGIGGGSPFLSPSSGDLQSILNAEMFGGFGAYPNMGDGVHSNAMIYGKNGGFDMSNGKGMVSAIVMARDLNTQLSAIVNTNGADPSSGRFPNMPAALVNGLVRMTSTPLGIYYVTNRNSGSCLNVRGGAVTDSNADIIQWGCGSPVANNMLFIKRDVGEKDGSGNPYFMLQSVNSGHCVHDWGTGTIVQWDCNGSDAQLFTFSPTTSGYGHIVSKASGHCFDVNGGTNPPTVVDNACSSAAQQDFLFNSNVPADSGSAYAVPELFWPNDNNVSGTWGTGGSTDWASGSAKGQCTPGQPVSGLSESVDHSRVESVLCETYPGDSTTYPQNNCHPGWFSVASGDNYPSPWPWGSSYPDWDPWYYKAQCAPNEYVAGVAQNLSGQVDAILCCTGNVTASSCEDSTNAEVFYNGPSHSQTGIDWDWGYYKGQCPAGKYVQGVSAVGPWTGQLVGAAHALRCCSP